MIRTGCFPGLKSVPPSERPPVVPVFFAFRIMVGIGLLMIATGLFGAFLWWRGKLVTTRWYLQIVQYGWPLGFIAVLCGWITTEVGRQPWIAYGILRTADAISPVTAASVLTTLILFVIVYGIVFSDGPLLHQPPDRARPAGPGDRAAGPRYAEPPARRRARRRARSHRGRLTMEWYLPVIWAASDRHRGRALRHPRRLRSRHRHPVSLRQGGEGTGPDDQFDRAVLGRQRDLARARRRRTVGRVPARLCGRDAGALSAGDRDAARVDVSRRRLRIPHRRGHQQEILDLCVCRRLDASRRSARA